MFLSNQDIITVKSVLNSLFSIPIQAIVFTFSSATSLNYSPPPYHSPISYYYSPISYYRY